MGRTSSREHLLGYSAWKEKWPDVFVYQLLGWSQWLGCMVRKLGKSMIANLVKRKFEEEVCG